MVPVVSCHNFNFVLLFAIYLAVNIYIELEGSWPLSYTAVVSYFR